MTLQQSNGACKTALVSAGETVDGLPVLQLRDRARYIPRQDEDIATYLGRSGQESRDIETVTDGADIQVRLLDERRDGSRVAIRFRRHAGKHYLDIRRFNRTERGKLVPTKSGAAIRIEELWILADAIACAIEVAKGLRR